MTVRMIAVQGYALSASLLHVLIDAHLGLFGAPPAVTFVQAVAFAFIAALYGWWMAPLAVGIWGTRAGLLSLALLAGIWSFIVNGVVGIVACPIPCAAAAPYQDMAHLANIALGGAGAWYAWRVFRKTSGPITPTRTLTTTVVLLAATLLFVTLASARTL